MITASARLPVLVLVALTSTVSAKDEPKSPLVSGGYLGLTSVNTKLDVPLPPRGSLALGTTTPTGIVVVKESPPLLPEMIERHSEAVRKMLTAVTNADFPGFVFQGDKRFQEFEVGKFNELSRVWAARLAGGFGVSYLGEIKRANAATTVWRIRMNDKTTDLLVVMETNSRGSVSDLVLF